MAYINSYKDQLLSEANEIVLAINNNDSQNLKEEIGDVLYDALMLAALAERDGLFTLNDVLQEINEKISRRKPWLFDKIKVKDSADAVRLWNEAKQREKNRKIDNRA